MKAAPKILLYGQKCETRASGGFGSSLCVVGSLLSLDTATTSLYRMVCHIDATLRAYVMSFRQGGVLGIGSRFHPFTWLRGTCAWGRACRKRSGDGSSAVYETAKEIAAQLITDGFEPFGAGPLRIARNLEPFALLMGQLAHGGDDGPELA
jgi:hypothetical protein